MTGRETTDKRQHICCLLSVVTFTFAIYSERERESLKTVRPMLSDRCVSVCLYCPTVLFVCDVALRPNGWMDQDATWCGVGLSPGHIVLDEDPAAPCKKGHSSPHFSAHVYCGQTAGGISIPLGTEVGLRPGDIVLHGDADPPPRKGAQPPSLFGPVLWPGRILAGPHFWATVSKTVYPMLSDLRLFVCLFVCLSVCPVVSYM